MSKNIICERLSELIAEKEISPEILGEEIGISTSVVYYWLRDNRGLKLENLVNLASYFNCSLDFLVGRKEENGTFTHRDVPPFSIRLKQLIELSGKSVYQVRKETKINNSRIYDWFNGAKPKLLHLITLADYFGYSLDYLVGYED